jgi:hypothetical protein
MRANDRSESVARCRFRPRVEGMETRDLLSALLLSTPGHQQAVVQTRSVQPQLVAYSPTDQSLLQQFAQELYGSNPPSPRELRRETFTAKFLAYYTVGPPRFSDRASTIHGVTRGDVAVSNQFLKGRAQFVLFPPANPTATPNYGNPYANQVTGQATFFLENLLQTGSILIIDINGSGADEVNGLPTHATWKYDVSSGGAYTAPTYFTQGLGTVDFKYIPDRHPQPGTLGSGRVVVTFLGLINLNQIVNGIARIYS